MDSKIWLNFQAKVTNKLSKFEKILNKIFLVNFAIMVFFIFISFCFGYFSYNTILVDSADSLVINNILVFSNVFPISFVVAIKVSRILQTFLMNKKNPEAKVNDSIILTDLGKIDYIVTEKTGIITNENLRVHTCVIKDFVVYGEQGFIPRHSIQYTDDKIHSKSRKNSGISIGSMNEINSDPIELHEEPSLYNEKWYFILSLLLCNQVIQTSEMVCINAFEKILKDFAASMGAVLNHRENGLCEVAFKDKNYEYIILFAQYFNSTTKNYRIVIKNLNSEEVIFLTRGTKKSISRIINEEDYNILNEIIDFNNLFNMQLVVYAYKILTKQEILQLKFEMRNAKLSRLNTEGRKEAVFEKFEKNSKYLGIIAIENPVSDHTRESIKALTSAGIKI